MDEAKNSVSGCSIDSLQNKIQEIEIQLSISLLNRLNVFCKIDNEIKCIPIDRLNTIASFDTLFYDLTIQKKSDLKLFLKPIRDGWCSRFLK